MITSSADYPEPATLEIASSDGNGRRRSMSCLFHGMRDKRLFVEVNEPIPISTVISVQHEDVLFLGEIVATRLASGPAWNIEIKLEQILTGLQSLMALRARLIEEGVPQHPFLARPSGVFN